MPRSSSSAEPNPMLQAPVSQNPGLQHSIQQLKQQYPDSSLVAEFLTYAANEYAVRVLVKVGDRILSTGMAAASDLEQAEDRARMRAIAALGMEELKVSPASTEATLSLAHTSNSNQTPQPPPDKKTEEHNIPFTGGSNVNLADAIAKTSVEMQRLGWDIHQGREHLLVTYGKRSRGELNDDELLDFLHFLEKQSPPEVTP